MDKPLNELLEEYIDAYNKEEQEKIGDLIKEKRLEKNLSQGKLAKLLSVQNPIIYKYEKGLIKTIPFEKRVKLALILNIDIIDLLYSTEDDLKLCIARSKKSCQ